MSSMQRFDGPSLEAVLATVQATHGESARILNAHRVRAGGLGGFFAKERFEVEVEVEPGAAGPGAGDGGTGDAGGRSGDTLRPPASILDLADEVSAQESESAPSAFASMLAARLATEHARSTLHPVGGDGESPGTGSASPSTPSRSAPSGSAPSGSAPSRPSASRSAPTRSYPAARPEVAAPAHPAPDPAARRDAAVLAHPAAAPRLAAGPSPAAVLRSVPAPGAAAPQQAFTVDAQVPDDGPAGAGGAPEESGRTGDVVALERPRPVLAFPTRPPTRFAIPELARPQPADAVAAGLMRRGLPSAFVPAGPVVDVRAGVIAALDRLPTVPAIAARRASVVAVVGTRDEAFELAGRLGAEHGAHADHVLLASPSYRGRRIPSWHRLSTVQEAASERRSWCRRTKATVVAIEAPVDGDQTEWAAEMLAALEPNLTWGIVNAGRKTDDLAWWMGRLGGVDALALTGVDRTLTPGDVLSLGVPVGLLDGRPATAEGWADLLLAGLAS